MVFSDVKSKAHGWEIVYTPCKQKKSFPRTFVIPKKDGAGFIDHHAIFQRYYDKITEDVKPKPDDTLFWTGKSGYKQGSPKFIRNPLGINEMRKVCQTNLLQLTKDTTACSGFDITVILLFFKGSKPHRQKTRA